MKIAFFFFLEEKWSFFICIKKTWTRVTILSTIYIKIRLIYLYDNIKRKEEKIKRKVKEEIICGPFVFFIKTIKYKIRKVSIIKKIKIK
jgi:hypothetical protein